MKRAIKNQLSRRKFVNRSVVGVGGVILPAYAAAGEKKENRVAPSERVNLACIGVGGRARNVIPSLCKHGAEVVALCDVDFESGREIERNLSRYPDAPRFNDFRVMFDQMEKDIDAVCVVTPDHTHFVATMHAMSLGKHVYTEKPLARTFMESEILMRAEQKFGVVTQMGNQGHTGNGIELFAKMVDSGLCDRLTKFDAWKTPSLWFMKPDERLSLPLSKDPVPDSLSSWDLWCGPRRKLPFNKMYHPFNWRGFHEFGMGMLGDWGAHIIDYVHDKLELGLPTEIKSLRMDDHNRVFYPSSSRLSMHFPARGENRPAIDMTWRDGLDCKPETLPRQLWENGKGGQNPPHLPGAGSILYSDDSDIAIIRGHHGDSPRVIPESRGLELAASLNGEKGKDAHDHFADFINACKGHCTTNSPFSIGGKLTQVLSLGTIAQFLNADLQFDPTKKQFSGNEEANNLLNPPCRKEWEHYYEMA